MVIKIENLVLEFFDDFNVKFKDWYTRMSGTENSNMSRIKSAFDAMKSEIEDHEDDTVAHVTADDRIAWSSAEANAKSYTNEQIAGIPAPDVSGQISTHNSSGGAHQDIRNSLDSKLNSVDISAWAKAPTKPIYTASEVGALGSPANAGATGQVLTKTSIGSMWETFSVTAASLKVPYYGTYVGNCGDGDTQTINLGFTPTAVMVWQLGDGNPFNQYQFEDYDDVEYDDLYYDEQYCNITAGFIGAGHNIVADDDSEDNMTIGKIVTNGFLVGNASWNNSGSTSRRKYDEDLAYRFANNKSTYGYVAYR